MDVYNLHNIGMKRFNSLEGFRNQLGSLTCLMSKLHPSLVHVRHLTSIKDVCFNFVSEVSPVRPEKGLTLRKGLSTGT